MGFELGKLNKEVEIIHRPKAHFRKYYSLGIIILTGVFLQFLSTTREYAAGPLFDMAFLYAFLSAIPSFVFFMIAIGPSFFKRIEDYNRKVNDGGTYKNISCAGKDIKKTILIGFRSLVGMQLAFNFLLIAIGGNLLPGIVFTGGQLMEFVLLSIAFFFYELMFMIWHALMQLKDWKVALTLSGMFFASTTLVACLAVLQDIKVGGILVISFIIISLSVWRLWHILRNINYYMYCVYTKEWLT